MQFRDAISRQFRRNSEVIQRQLTGNLNVNKMQFRGNPDRTQSVKSEIIQNKVRAKSE